MRFSLLLRIKVNNPSQRGCHRGTSQLVSWGKRFPFEFVLHILVLDFFNIFIRLHYLYFRRVRLFLSWMRTVEGRDRDARWDQNHVFVLWLLRMADHCTRSLSDLVCFSFFLQRINFLNQTNLALEKLIFCGFILQKCWWGFFLLLVLPRFLFLKENSFEIWYAWITWVDCWKIFSLQWLLLVGNPGYFEHEVLLVLRFKLDYLVYLTKVREATKARGCDPGHRRKVSERRESAWKYFMRF